MDWVRLGVRYFFDPKIRGMGGDLADAAEVMFTRSVAWAGELKRDGFIPESDVVLLTRRRRHEAVVKVLVELGLWVAVPGGYQVQRWPDWNGDNIDALTRRRAADRERQRRRRERAQQSPPPLSRDASRDVTVAEVEVEKEKEGGYSSVDNTPPSTARPQPPPDTCDKHPDGTSDPCRACQRRREKRQQWDAERAAARAERDRASQQWPRHRCGHRHPPNQCPLEAR